MNPLKTNNDITLFIFPFENLSGEKGMERFIRAFYFEMITQFSRFRQFKVISGDASSDIGIAADYLIKGSFSEVGKSIKVTTHLIKAPSANIVWADRYDGDKDAFQNIQEAMVMEVVSGLQLQINQDLMFNLRRKTELRPYEHWLFGMEELKKGTLKADEVARSHFQDAIEKDSDFSLGYSGMSLTYFNEWSCQLWDRWDVSHKGAYDWAKKAIDLDPQNYVASFILGRIYVYEAHYDIGENFLRRALALNANDPEILISTAMAFVYLNLLKEADELYHKAIGLNSLHANQYGPVGALIAFEKGDYNKCLSIGESIAAPWVDYSALIAAAFFYTGNREKMQEHWTRFMQAFQHKILKNEREATSTEALQWQINVSPYKGETNFKTFWDQMRGDEVLVYDRSFQKATPSVSKNQFLKDGEFWQISFLQNTVRIPEVKGFYDLVKLLATPDKEYHCTALMGSVLNGRGEFVFDEKAKSSYRRRIHELEEEIKASEFNNDPGKATSLHEEYDAILGHLSASLGLKGKIRKSNDPVEKARSAVTWRIRHAIQRIEKLDPVLGKHLSHSIQTGVFCKYAPEKPVEWIA